MVDVFVVAILVGVVQLGSVMTINAGEGIFAFAGGGLQPFFEGLAVLAAFWLILYWMYRRKLFLKI